MRQIPKLALMLFVGLIFTSNPVFAAEPVERTNTNALWFESWGHLSNATLKIGAPDGNLTTVFAKTGTPTFHLRDLNPISDGVYRYELTAATDEMVPAKKKANNGRGEGQKDQVHKSFQMGGFFIVTRGVITKQDDLKEE